MKSCEAGLDSDGRCTQRLQADITRLFGRGGSVGLFAQYGEVSFENGHRDTHTGKETEVVDHTLFDHRALRPIIGQEVAAEGRKVERIFGINMHFLPHNCCKQD